MVALLFAGAQTLSAQRTITGTIISADDNTTVPGASVSIQGTTIGTIADMDGRFSISVPADATHLVFSFMGMETQTVEIGGRTTIDVRMSSDAIGLDEVVVTALGISRSERSLGFTTQNVDGDDLIQRSEPDALRALEGRIPGVDISGMSGAAGSSTRITIRGNSTFGQTANNQPLIVVDGIPFSNVTLGGSGAAMVTGSGGAFGNSFSTLDPNDIESMQVLKGAAAAALYGSRAAHGVILITTRSGSRAHRPQQRGTEITVQSSWAWETISDLPNFQNTWGAGSNFTEGLSTANGSWGGRMGDDVWIPAWPSFTASFPDWAAFAAQHPHRFRADSMMLYQAQPNNVRDLFRTGFMQDYSFNVSSQMDRGVINLTASRMNHEGYVPNSHFRRTSVSVGGNTILVNRLRVGGNVAFSNTDQLGSTFGTNLAGGGQATSAFARTLHLGRNWDVNLPWVGADGRPLCWTGDRTQFDHPMWAVYNNTHNTAMNRIVAQANLGFDITDWLNISYQIGYNFNATDRRSIIGENSRAFEGLGAITAFNVQQGEIESNLMLTVTRMLTRDISLQAMVGQNINQRTYNEIWTRGTDFLVPGVFTMGNTANQELTSWSSIHRLAAVFGDVQFGFRNYLFLNVTGRNDWSSTLPPGNNSYFYPAVSASFVVTDAFPQIRNQYLSMARLRASWARVGNDAGVFLDYAGRNMVFATPFRGQPRMFVPVTLVDENLMPEFTSEIELGGSLGFLNNRLNVDLTWYDRRTTGQIASLTVPFSTGFTGFMTNFGEVQNTGIELSVDVTPVVNRHFEWNLGWNLTRNRNYVISVFEGEEDSDEAIVWGVGLGGRPNAILQPGMPFGFLRGTVVHRDTDGAFLVRASDGMLTVSPTHEKLGNPAPRFVTSLISTMRSHGVTLGILVDARVGGVVYSPTVSTLLGRGVTYFNYDRMGGRFIPGYIADPADPSRPLLDADGNRIRNTTPITEQNVWFGAGSFAINAANEFAVFDATTFRLREISLGYDIPRQWLERLPIGSASVSFTARNLWFWSPHIPRHTNIDPIGSAFGADMNMQGFQEDIAPSTRRFGVNLRFTF